MNRHSHRLSFIALSLLLSACTVGPDYQAPALNTPESFKQVAGWKVAEPAAQMPEDWWSLYGDAELDALIERLNANNQSLASAAASYRQAQAIVRGARAGFLPQINLNTGVSRAGQGGGSSTIGTTEGVSVSGANAASVSKTYEASLGVSWELDLWGKLRRQLEADQASLAASAADLAAVRLSQQSQLVQNYLQLRVLDEQKRLLEATLAAYERSLKLTQNQYNAGIVPKSDVSQAQSQLHGTRAQLIDLEYQRAQFEHAIAVLIGVAPSELSLAPRAGVPELPGVPASVPSRLLERRPDIAAAERRVMSANAQIGVAEAAWYPDLTLSATGGYRNGALDGWFSLPNRFWSIGPSFATVLFDGGLIRSQVEQAEAAYDISVADYRQTVLTGFREVEDYLVQLDVYSRELAARELALESAREALRLVENQYKAGTVDYNAVVSLQASALDSERNWLSLKGNRLLASAQLITALGGGWQTGEKAEVEASKP